MSSFHCHQPNALPVKRQHALRTAAVASASAGIAQRRQLQRSTLQRFGQLASMGKASRFVAMGAAGGSTDSGALLTGITEAIDKVTGNLSEEEIAAMPPVGKLETITFDEDVTGDVIRVPDDFNPLQGLKLTDELKLGEEIGGGVQGAVYQVLDKEGNKTEKLLKVMKYKFATPVTGLDVGLKREWLIGRQLNRLTDETGKLKGFMGTGEALINTSDMLEGLVLEKLNGWPLEKRMWKNDDFADVFYLLEMMQQVFVALDKAYHEVGFIHKDMRLANIMENRPDGSPYLPQGYSDKDFRKRQMRHGDDSPVYFKLPGEKKAKELEFKIIDYGHARLVGNKTETQLPEPPAMEHWYRKWFEGKGDVWRLLQDISDAIDGRTWPLEDKEEVQVVLGLIREVTGIKVCAHYAPRGSVFKQQGWPWQRVDGRGHGLRRAIIRILAFLAPRKVDFTAREALEYLESRVGLPEQPAESSSKASSSKATKELPQASTQMKESKKEAKKTA